MTPAASLARPRPALVRLEERAGSRWLLVAPLLGLLVAGFVGPCAVLLARSLSPEAVAIGPLTLAHYAAFLTDEYYREILARTLAIGALTTALAIAVGYPLAFGIVFVWPRWAPVLLWVLLLPFLVNIVVRAYGWMVLLADGGLVNRALLAAGLVAEPLPLMFHVPAVVVALLHRYLPFMVLILVATLRRIPPDLVPAAAGLGDRPLRAFRRVVLPLSVPGVVAGAQIVFASAVSDFVLPFLLGGPRAKTLAPLVYEEAIVHFHPAFAAAVSTVLLVVGVGATMLAGWLARPRWERPR